MTNATATSSAELLQALIQRLFHGKNKDTKNTQIQIVR